MEVKKCERKRNGKKRNGKKKSGKRKNGKYLVSRRTFFVSFFMKIFKRFLYNFDVYV
jgi:hypothetical protein